MGTASLSSRKKYFTEIIFICTHNAVSSIDVPNCVTRNVRIHSNRAACDKMTVVRVLHFLEICITLQLLLLPLQLLRSHPCPATVEELVVATTSDADKLADDLLCDGPASFTASWHGIFMVSRTVSVSNGSTLNVTGVSGSEDADTGAVVISDGSVRLFEVDIGSAVSLAGLTMSGGDGALRVTRGSFAEVIDCRFLHNERTSSEFGGGLAVLLIVLFHLCPHAAETARNKEHRFSKNRLNKNLELGWLFFLCDFTCFTT